MNSEMKKFQAYKDAKKPRLLDSKDMALLDAYGQQLFILHDVTYS